jgi:hypothetical protein
MALPQSKEPTGHFHAAARARAEDGDDLVGDQPGKAGALVGEDVRSSHLWRDISAPDDLTYLPPRVVTQSKLE